MQKISIKREQSQAGLSFAEREKFRPQVKNKLLLLLALLMTAATGAWAQEQWDVVWDFTAWSTETVTALKADAAASKLEGWSDVEKKADAEAGADPTAATKDNCFWSCSGTVNADGNLSANDVVIKEFQGLKFNSDYAARRELAIAVNYPSTSLGTYHGSAYLYLGGKNQTCFTIPGVKAGSKITIEVESHNTSSARGIGLYKNSYAEENLIGEQFTPKTLEAKTWEIAEDCNVVVYNTNNCHIYTIKVKAPAAAASAGYSVTMKDDLAEPTLWTASPNADVKKGQTVTVTYSGTKKVLGMKVEKYNPDPKAVPLTFEVLTNGTIKVSFPRNGMKYSLNGGEKTAVPGGSESDISVKAGDIIEFYGNGSSYYNMGSDHTSFGGTAEVKVYGNIMSLLSETNFATATTLTAEQTFRELFRSYSKLTDASGLLLPAMTLTNNCYYEMFSSCSKLTTAPVLPATSLVSNCYRSMFSYCSKLSSVTCLATSGIDSNNSTYNWMLSAGSQAAGDKTFTADKTAEWPNTGNGIPSGWTRVDYVAPGN